MSYYCVYISIQVRKHWEWQGFGKSHYNTQHTRFSLACLSNWIKLNMPTLHPTNRHSARAPCVSAVTRSSRGLKGQSSSSESARSTTTPGWRHWVGRWWWVRHGCFCVCVQYMCVGWVTFMCIILTTFKSLLRKKFFKMTATMCGNLHSWCQEYRFCQLQLSVEWNRVKNQHYNDVLSWCIMTAMLRTGRWPLPQPASRIPQSLSPWSGTACRSPRPPYNHSSSSWSISLYTKTRSLQIQIHCNLQ